MVEEVTYVYSCPKCGSMIRPEKELPLIKGSIATPSLVSGIMNAKYVNGMPLASLRREKDYDLLSIRKSISEYFLKMAMFRLITQHPREPYVLSAWEKRIGCFIIPRMALQQVP